MSMGLAERITSPTVLLWQRADCLTGCGRRSAAYPRETQRAIVTMLLSLVVLAPDLAQAIVRVTRGIALTRTGFAWRAERALPLVRAARILRSGRMGRSSAPAEGSRQDLQALCPASATWAMSWKDRSRAECS